MPSIAIPGTGGYDGPWTITDSWLKLQLKYGLVGDWQPARTNWSVAFDAYALTRGPETGIPTLTDATVTTLMNSGLRKVDLTNLSNWLSDDANVATLEGIASELAASDGLHDAASATLQTIGQFADRMLGPDGLRRFRRAKLFKWLAAWAPAHVPMLDSLVVYALTSGTKTPTEQSLRRFQVLLQENLEVLTDLGERLSEGLAGALPGPVPPVRVLDSLIWFDWWLGTSYYEGAGKPFRNYVLPASSKTATQHPRA